MIALEFNCRFHYPGGFTLDFSFSAAGGVTALVGPSGSGKTTVLNLIAGLLTPDSGTITLNGQRLFNSKTNLNLPPQQRAIGYVFQDFQLFPHLTVEQNLRYGQCRTRKPGLVYEIVVKVLELGDLTKRYPVTLSGGQKQRVALGRALLRSPQLLLLDEPLTALDSELRGSIAEYLSRAIEEFCIPTLLVSHDQESIRWLAHSTVELGKSNKSC
jgi:molybdate transport system ATP-binding protein